MPSFTLEEKKDDAVAPLEGGLKTLLLPEVAVKLACGAYVGKDGPDIVVSFEGDSIRLHEKDFDLAARVAQKLKAKMPQRPSVSGILFLGNMASQYVSEELFKPGAVRVIYYPSLTPASAWYRCVQPAAVLGKSSRVIAHVSSRRIAREALAHDVSVIQIDHTPATQAFAKALKGLGKKVVFEIDDAFDALDPSHPQYETYSNLEEQDWVQGMFRLADAVTVTTENLKGRYSKLTERIEIVPNMVDLSSWPKAKPNEDGTFRILWAGSKSHAADLELAAGALWDFARKHENVRIIFFGDSPKGIPEDVRSKAEIHPFVDFAVYPLKLAELRADLAIAPLVDNAFNRGKSPVKAVEYIATGYPVLASKVRAYEGMGGVIYAEDAAWPDMLEVMHGSSELRSLLRKEGSEYIHRYDTQRNVTRLERFFVGLAENGR